MRYVVFSLYDKAAAAFGIPMFMQNKGVAIRSFGDEVNRKDQTNNLHNHPEHFELYELGWYDDSSGTFTSEKQHPIAVANARELKQE